MKYSDQIGYWLREMGYTHYFYVGGGNIMHLTESLDRFLIGKPVVHEVAAGIAAEYFNEVNVGKKRALALVTAGPGVTNIVTAVSGAWLESRELLVIGGQVKVSDLSNGDIRGRGIQEVDGVKLLSSTTKASSRMYRPFTASEFKKIVQESWTPRKGPVFLEIPLNVQAADVKEESIGNISADALPKISDADLDLIVRQYEKSSRPILLVGGGVDYSTAENLKNELISSEIPIMTTYNGADRICSEAKNYLGRPNTWGQRSSNIIIQKSDLIIAIGTRLGLQQTGFNWQEFGREAKIVQIEIDKAEIKKGHPKIDYGYAVDANDFLSRLLKFNLSKKTQWLTYAREIINKIPRIEDVNKTGEEYISPYEFICELEKFTAPDDVIIPCSSGSAFTLTMQLYRHKFGQRVLTNKSLASMGYGLSGAIGACIGYDNCRRTILIEGDGGFAQNMQELGTAKINDLNMKIFIFNDRGHASIRMTQRNYFNGKYLGCDQPSGLGLPDWKQLFKTWNIESVNINRNFSNCDMFLKKFNEKGIVAFIVDIDPEQTYFPKISSRVTSDGGMESNPIDKMSPEINSIFSGTH